MKPLVIFELSNNHMGSISHARLIIQKYYELSKKFKNKIDFAIKFQYRDSKTFIHKTFYDSNDKQIPYQTAAKQFALVGCGIWNNNQQCTASVVDQDMADRARVMMELSDHPDEWLY